LDKTYSYRDKEIKMSMKEDGGKFYITVIKELNLPPYPMDVEASVWIDNISGKSNQLTKTLEFK
jgi:hypothetical protein